jgi:chromosomal replication initiation ATPase DnaA
MHKIANGTQADLEFLVRRLTERGLLELLDQICEARNVTRLEIAGKARSRSIVRARQELWSLLRAGAWGYSFHEIGKLFRRHHSTIAYGIAAHERAMRRELRRMSVMMATSGSAVEDCRSS